MCKATRGDHYSYKDSLKLSDYKVQDVAATAAGGQAASQGHNSMEKKCSSFGLKKGFRFHFDTDTCLNYRVTNQVVP